uniref:Inverted formin-2-like n=1 Tax=Panagrellus redivivus TaxID=6233 RepID=A0A7E4UXQ3_PANRE
MDPLTRILLLESVLAWVTVVVAITVVVSGCFKPNKISSNKNTRSSDQTDNKNLITPTQDPALIPVKSPIEPPKPVSTPRNPQGVAAKSPALPPPPPSMPVSDPGQSNPGGPKAIGGGVGKGWTSKKSAKRPKRQTWSKGTVSNKSHSKRLPDSEAKASEMESEKPKKRTASLDSQDGCDNNVMIVSSKEEIQQPPQSH